TRRMTERQKQTEPGQRPWDSLPLRCEIVHEFQAISAATAHLHILGIVHRDIKPENVLVMWDGSLRLSDFGIVKDLKPSGRQTSRIRSTSPGERMGTEGY